MKFLPFPRRFAILWLLVLAVWPQCILSFKIFLLTHANEMLRLTNTGKLLMKETFLTEAGETLAKTEILIWEGRSDNMKVADAISQLHQPTLIWTDATKVTQVSDIVAPSEGPTYIILDGTWQEAKKIFRHGPHCLRCIPRMSLQPTFRSKYRLRGNFGYIDRFTSTPNNSVHSAAESAIEALQNTDTASNLLCTAEVGASLLQRHGHNEIADRLLNELEEFQMSFQSYSTTRKSHH